ncbi:MAG: hypothetical protein BSR46_04215 [Candidatus Dactylopiibacterium carminicum]|nr:methyl-accepting chemotaxis protein [Candidatus Dactylopiibacterium carminicum]PAT00101.1 MAG: hypothetical protein BSR46_04215 [Candidatus Dactylopiibacterium carminicum]
MRINHPVTGQERPFPKGKVIISRTDARGHITHVNDAFIGISGFTREELVGQPHNLLRHPDVPPEVFRDVWATIQAGRPWTGVIKNRCKNGDHYWVRANLTGLPDGSGYMSVRTEASRSEIQTTEALFAQLHARRAPHLLGGRTLPTGGLGRLVSFNRHVRLAWRFWATFLVFALLMLLGAGIAQYGQQVLGTELRNLIERDQIRLQAYADMHAQGLQAGQALRNVILDPQNSTSATGLETADTAFMAALTRAGQLTQDDGERQALEKIRAQHEIERQLRAGIVAQARAGERDAAIAALNHDGTPAWLALEQLILAQQEASRQQSDAAALETLAEARQRRTLGLVAIALSLLAGIAMFAAMISYLARNMAKTRELLRGIAESGDLSAPLPIGMYDEIGEVLTQIAIMRNKLHELVADLVDRIATMGPQARALNETSGEGSLAARRQSQAAAAMASAIEQMSVSVDQMRDRANESKALSEQTDQLANSGGRIIRQTAEEISLISSAVQQVVEAVTSLQDHSAHISSIVQVIREIADQTNLLALNAAIEAARAGDSGRGFAVVADEVRGLAERTSRSTVEITQMVAMIQQGTRSVADSMDAATSRVTEGVDLAHRAGDAVTEIQGAVAASAEAVAAIFDALREQASTTHEISRRVEEIAQDSEQGAHAASQTSNAANMLSTLAEEMHQLAQRFRIS